MVPAPASLGMPLQLLLAAALALPSAALSGADDAAALVQVEVLIADVAKRSHRRSGPETHRAESELAAGAPVQLHSVRRTEQSARIAEAQGTSFDVDLSFNFSAAKISPTDPAKVDKILQTMRNYTQTAVDFGKMAILVARKLNHSTAHGFGEMKHTLCDAFSALCNKANALEREFVHSISSNVDAMPGPMQEMALKQSETARVHMHDFVAPLAQMREVLVAAQTGSDVCGTIEGKLTDLSKQAKVLVALNRNQALGSEALIAKMPETWKPWVNISLIKEMGGMASQTANSVENAALRVNSAMEAVMRNRLDCTSGAAPRLLHAIVVCALILGLSWLPG